MTKKLPPLKSAPPVSPEPASLETVKSTAPPAMVIAAPVAPPSNERLKAAQAMVGRYRVWAAAGGAVPAPLIDIVIITGLQVRMLAGLAKLYDVPFDKVRARSLISALVGGIVPQGVAGAVVGSAAKTMPGVGTVIGIGSAIATAAFTTEMVGKWFIQHFEAGGSLIGSDQ